MVGDRELEFDPDEEEALRRWTFDDMKQRMQDMGDRLGDDGDLPSLGGAVTKCKESLKSKNMDALESAIQECRGVLAHTCQGRGVPDAEPTTRSDDWLQRWRPSRNYSRAHDVPCSEAPTRPPSRPEPKEEEDEAHVNAASSHVARKAEADAAARGGDYEDALRVYEDIIESGVACTGATEEASLEDRELGCAVYSNAALCTLKLSPDERSWPRIAERLRHTVELCDKALYFDSTHAKSHYRRGCALEALERFPEAYRAYERAVAHEPADAKIREAMERMVRYDLAELGAEAYADAQARLETLEPALAAREKQRRRKLGQKRSPNAFACCRCSGDAQVGNFFALPCGHGPYCRDCRGRIVREGRGLMFCAAHLCGDVITDFQAGPVESPGSGMLTSATGQSSNGGSQRPVFGPELPPEMRRKSARPKCREKAPKVVEEAPEVEAAPHERATVSLHALD